MTKIKLPNGREYQFAPLRFTRDACDLIDMHDSFADDVKSFTMGQFLRCLRTNMIQSLSDGGHSPDEIEEAVSSLPISMKADATFRQIFASMLDEE